MKKSFIKVRNFSKEVFDAMSERHHSNSKNYDIVKFHHHEYTRELLKDMFDIDFNNIIKDEPIDQELIMVDFNYKFYTSILNMKKYVNPLFIIQDKFNKVYEDEKSILYSFRSLRYSHTVIALESKIVKNFYVTMVLRKCEVVDGELNEERYNELGKKYLEKIYYKDGDDKNI